MNRFRTFAAAVSISLTLASCASFNAYRKAQEAEQQKNWDAAVTYYESALEISPDNTQYKLALARAKREASRAHFEKGKQFRAASQTATGGDQARLAQLAATELELTVRLDPTNQFAAVELSKAVQFVEDSRRAANEATSIDEIKRRSKANVSKAAPPQLNPASNEPISLTFPRDTPVRDIYKALGNAFGINILFDQAVKDDRITIELRDVTAQQALERVMQAAGHFYKALDEKTIIVIPDNPQARRDYEDLVIQTFYLSNGDAEQVTNVVRTMIDARNVFPLKALNAITIRDTADKVRIAEKIIEANDKAKAEVVVQVELIQLDLSRVRDLGFAVSGFPGTSGVSGTAAASPVVSGTDKDGKPTMVPFTGGTLGDIARILGSANDLKSNLSFTIPQATYGLLKTLGNSELLASPELRISEGEKATLHIGQRIPVPVSTFTSVATGQPNTGTYAPVTSYQYQDVGIKVGMEPRVHHNREVTLKLNVEVSNLGAKQGDQPTFATRTIDSTIRLKDGETNFLAGLIQRTQGSSDTKTPFLGDLPFIGRLFTNTHKEELRTDLVLTMTPHIIRIADITEDDVAPMWVGTINNLSFRGVSPRMESQVSADPFGGGGVGSGAQLFGNSPAGPAAGKVDTSVPRPGVAPQRPRIQPQPVPEDGGSASLNPGSGSATPSAVASASLASASVEPTISETADSGLRLPPRIAAQPSSITLKPGEMRMWNVVAMDVDGLVTDELSFRFNPEAIEVRDVTFGAALLIDPAHPPIVTINRDLGTVRVTSSGGKPLTFVSGGEILALRIMGVRGDASLAIANPVLRSADGQAVGAMVAGGHAKVQ